MDIWQFKIILLRKMIKGWAINIIANIKRQKKELLKEYEKFDENYEAGLLLPWDRAKMDSIMTDLDKIWCLEEMKARQRSKGRVKMGSQIIKG